MALKSRSKRYFVAPKGVSAFLAHNATADHDVTNCLAERGSVRGRYFVSYTSSDCDWAFWIAKELEATISKSAYCH